MQEVLPKQAPDAAETNRKRDNIEKREKEKKGKAKNKQTKQREAELCWSSSAVQEELFFSYPLKNSTKARIASQNKQ